MNNYNQPGFIDDLSDINIEQILIDAISETSDCFGIFDSNDNLIYCNSSLANIFGQQPERIKNQSFSQIIQHCYLNNQGVIIDTDDINEWLNIAHTKRRKQKFRNFELDLYDGRWFLMTEQMVHGNYIFLVATDITEKKQIEKKLKQTAEELFTLATTDSLTNINNRRYFLELVNIELQRSVRTQTSCSFLMLDLDNFKPLNDTFGHQAGDLTLKNTAKIIKNILRPYDVFGRIGGEEFAILLPETSLDTSLKIADRIRSAIERQTVCYLTHQIKVTASIGIANSKGSKVRLDQLMSEADKNLYRAKHAGRNTVIGFTL